MSKRTRTRYSVLGKRTEFGFWLSIAAVSVTIYTLLWLGIPAYFWFILNMANL